MRSFKGLPQKGLKEKKKKYNKSFVYEDQINNALIVIMLLEKVFGQGLSFM